jgi:hypothetical protein
LDMDLFEMVDSYANFCNGEPDIHRRSLALSPYHFFNHSTWKKLWKANAKRL